MRSKNARRKARNAAGVGARPLKRAIRQRIENPLSKLLLEGKFAPKDVIGVDVDPIKAPGQFSFEKV